MIEIDIATWALQWCIMYYCRRDFAPARSLDCRAKQQPQPASKHIHPSAPCPVLPGPLSSSAKQGVRPVPSSFAQVLGGTQCSRSGILTVQDSRAAPASRGRHTTSHAHATRTRLAESPWKAYCSAPVSSACLHRDKDQGLHVHLVLAGRQGSTRKPHLQCPSFLPALRSLILARHDALFIHFASRVTRTATHRCYAHA